MIKHKLTFFLFIFLILKNVNLEKIVTVEQVELASNGESGIKLKQDGKTVLDVIVHQSSPPAPKSIFKRQKSAVSGKKSYSPCFRFSLDSPGPKSICVNYMDYEWYGGPDRLNAKWPVQSHIIKEEPYVLNFTSGHVFGEPYWLTSNGQSIYVTSDSALLIDSNNRKKNHLCFIVNNTNGPYSNQPDILEYELCQFNNTVYAHKHALQAYLKSPKVAPVESLYRYPTYHTFNRYTTPNDAIVRNFANEILKKNFKIGALAISTGWESCYGSWTFDQTKFPSIKNLTNDLHALGVKVMVEAHPFINQNCQPYYNEARKDGRFVQSYYGGILSTCSQGIGSSVDFVNATTKQWFIKKVQNFIKTTGIDYIDYGGGAANLLPQPPVLNNDPKLIPDVYTTKYLEAISAVGIPAVVGVGKLTQHTSTLTRLWQKDRRFDLYNGLKASITQLLNANLHGYIFTQSDLIGGTGSGYYFNKELYIRWLQASIFMPSLQFSKLPWDFDEETVTIAKKFLDLRERKFNVIKAAIDSAIAKQQPVNAPIWWIAPDDEAALKVSDQYLLGEHMIVAPVLEANQRNRFVYLPKGYWRDCTTYPTVTQVEGPRWLYYPDVPLDQLPYFVNIYAPYPFYQC